MGIAEPKAELYKDAKGEWRFRLKSTNGRVIAVSSEGYKQKRSAKRAIKILGEYCWEAYIVEA